MKPLILQSFWLTSPRQNKRPTYSSRLIRTPGQLADSVQARWSDSGDGQSHKKQQSQSRSLWAGLNSGKQASAWAAVFRLVLVLRGSVYYSITLSLDGKNFRGLKRAVSPVSPPNYVGVLQGVWRSERVANRGVVEQGGTHCLACQLLSKWPGQNDLPTWKILNIYLFIHTHGVYFI